MVVAVHGISYYLLAACIPISKLYALPSARDAVRDTSIGI